MKLRSTQSAWLVALMASLCASCSPPPAASPQGSVFELTGPTMGTRYSIRMVVDDLATAESLQPLVDKSLADFGTWMSTYDPTSELSRFNSSNSTEPFAISAATAEVLSASLELARDSEGAFDPTVGPLVDAWGFGPPGKRPQAPSDDELAALKPQIGYDKLILHSAANTIRKTQPDVRIDLNAIAPGYAVDLVSRLLEEHGVSSYMVEIGGEVFARGRKPRGGQWIIGIENPNEDGRSVRKVVPLDGAAITTAGDYRNFYTAADGRRLSHTIDPRTLAPVAHSLASVTVYARDAMTADGIDTVLMVLGPDAGYDWATERNVAALFVERLPDGKFAERTTPAWQSQLVDVPADKTTE